MNTFAIGIGDWTAVTLVEGAIDGQNLHQETIHVDQRATGPISEVVPLAVEPVDIELRTCRRAQQHHERSLGVARIAVAERETCVPKDV